MVLFCAAPLTQAVVHWRQRSTKALSQWTVLLGISGLGCSLLYDHLFCLPFAYRLLHPLILFAWIVLALQEFWYSGRTRVRTSLVWSYGFLLLIMIGAVFFAQRYPVEVGTGAGWLFTFFYTFFQIPQLIKNQQRRSVEGLSFWYITLLGTASCVELFLSLWCLLPPQSFLNALRGVVIYAIFVYQWLSFSVAVKEDRV